MIGTKILEERESKINGHLRVSRSWGFGTYIQAQGLTQSGGIVGVIWKPTLKKVKSQKLEVKSCLILGLGGGTVAKYVRLFWNDAKITGVDIDPVMIELGKKYLGLGETNVEIKIGDAFKEIQKSKIKSQNYDLIIVDLYNGDKFPDKFASSDFLLKIPGLLKIHGIVVFNRTYYGDKRREAIEFGEKLLNVFKKVEYFRPEANLMFICTT